MTSLGLNYHACIRGLGLLMSWIMRLFPRKKVQLQPLSCRPFGVARIATTKVEIPANESPGEVGPVPTWRQPALTRVKINSDAAICTYRLVVGSGTIARDENDNVLVERCRQYPGITNPSIAETNEL